MGTVINAGTIPKLWSDDYLSKLATEAEIQISTEIPCIYTRFCLPVVAGESIYDFSTLAVPQRLTGIIRITWQGYTVIPVFQRQLRNNVTPLKPGSDTETSRPRLFMRLGYGIDGIKFFASPNLTIPDDASDINSQAAIRNLVIVSGWSIADPTGTTLRIPDYVRETLVRYYVMARAYRKEGKGQNLTAAKHFDDAYNRLLKHFKVIVGKLFTARTSHFKDGVVPSQSAKPPHPVLPPNFGTPVL